MKKTILTALAALLVAVPAVQAQKVNKEALLAKIEKSDADIANEKKAAKAATWINRGKAFYEVAIEPTKSLFVNMEATMLKLAVGEPKSTEKVTLNGAEYDAWVYTCDGDANLDMLVNVQDVTATVSYILRDKDNMIPNFGFAEADVNYNNNVEIADVIGIVNLIHGKPVTKASALRSEAEVPVQMELDADNFLTMNSQVPVAGIYLELVGAIDEIPLLGDAAKFLQASSLNGDTLRVIGYSLDGRTIPSGKSRILRMPAGVTLVGASFSDAKANSLRSGGDAIVTSNAPIEAISQLAAVSNYPNPFRGSTTFRYQLTEAAESVTIHVFSANGALAAVLNGLPGEVGDNQYSATLTLPAGVYYYRLTAKTGHGVKASNTNIFICK